MPVSSMRLRTTAKISSTRGSMMSESTRRAVLRGRCPPTPGTSISSSSPTMRPSAQPDRRLSRSASAIGVRRPGGDVARDVVAADGDDAGVGDAAVDVEQDVGRAAADVDDGDADLLLVVAEDGLGAGERLRARRRPPSGRSARRSGSTFWTQLVAAVTRFTFTPRRTPAIPMGSRMPSWLSTMYSRGRTCRIWRSASTGMARAPSSTRSTSLRVTSPPAMAATPSLRRRANVAAADARVDGPDLHAGHRLRALDRVLDRAHRPVDVGDDPLAEAAAWDDSDPEDRDAVGASTSATTAQTFVVPMSRPTTISPCEAAVLIVMGQSHAASAGAKFPPRGTAVLSASARRRARGACRCRA